MLIAALDKTNGKIIQVAGPDFDWGTSGVKMLAFVQHDDATVEAALADQIKTGGPAYIAYPYAVYDLRGRMIDVSSENYDLSLLPSSLQKATQDDSQASPILKQTDFSKSGLVVRVVKAVGNFISSWL